MPALSRTVPLRQAALALIAAAAGLPACAPGDGVTAAVTPAIPSRYVGLAFVVDVDKRQRSVRITPPAAGQLSPSLAATNATERPALSLLGNDVISVSATNFQEGALDAVVRGKVLVTFDLVVQNRLTGIALDTPTWPTPPAGEVGLQAFPFSTTVLARTGNVTSVEGGVSVSLPTLGSVAPSTDWDGAPHNFFDGSACTATGSNCFRYEPFGRIAAGGASEPRRVGFLLDPGVASFQTRVILAADLTVATPP